MAPTSRAAAFLLPHNVPVHDALIRFFKRHGWLAVLILAAVFVVLALVDTARLHRARERLGPGPFTTDVELGIGIAAALAVIAVLVVRRRLDGRTRKVVGGVAIAAWFIAFGWEHPRYSHTSLTSSPDVVMTVAGDLPLLLLGVLFLFSRAVGLTWPPTRRPSPAAGGHSSHTAEVWHVIDNQKRPTFDPYFIAHCSCDWTGTAHSGPGAEQQALNDARSHTPDVAPGVQRPLG